MTTASSLSGYRQRSLAVFPAGSNGEYGIPEDLVPVLERMGAWTERRLPPKALDEVDIAPLPDIAPAPSRVIVCGYGRVGQTVGAMLQVHDVPFLAIDMDAKEVSKHRGKGQPVAYGDATRV